MPTAVTRRRRAVRGATFGTVLTLSAVLAHALAGGMVPGRSVVAGSLAVLCLAGWLLSGRDRSPLVLGAAAVAGQVALHLTFSLTMPGSMSMSSLLCGRSAAGAPSPDTTLLRMRMRPTVPAATSHQMLLMMAAHALGGVVVLLALRSGERVVAAVAGLLGAVLRWSLPVGAPRVVRRVRGATPVPGLCGAPLVQVSPRRGPPVLARS